MPGMKPVLPTLNLAKVKHYADEQQSDGSNTARSFRAYRPNKATTVHNPQQIHAQNVAGTAAAASTERYKERASLASNISQHQTNAVVPHLNLSAAALNAAALSSRHDGLGFGSSGGIDNCVSARAPQTAANYTVLRGAATARVPAHSQDTTQSTAHAAHQAAATAAAAEQQESSSTAWESGSITCAQALKRYSEYLTNFEQSEILDYPQVYFVGRSNAQKVKGNPHLTKCNCGYDDDRGDYLVTMHDHLAYRYEVLSVLGKGSFGQVLKCHDFKTQTLRAVKIIRNKKRFHHQAMVELKVLEHLRQLDPDDACNVVHIHDHFTFRNHLCISFELLSLNLYEFIKQNNFMGLSLGLIRRFAHQILVALRFMKSLNIIHCDLKPENILLRQPNRSTIKVIDFGSSCFKDERIYTYIQSRFYRSPEVILGLPYGPEIDMWSFGCILAELYTGYPLFPGEDEAEQLQCIMEVLSVPPLTLLEQASRRKLFFDSQMVPRITPNSQGKVHTPGTKQLQHMLKCTDLGFLDLLEKCLRWDPAQRISPEQAMQHVWIMDQSPSPTSRQRQVQRRTETVMGHTAKPQGSAAHAALDGAAATQQAGAAPATSTDGSAAHSSAPKAAASNGALSSRSQVTDSAMGHAAGVQQPNNAPIEAVLNTDTAGAAAGVAGAAAGNRAAAVSTSRASGTSADSAPIGVPDLCRHTSGCRISQATACEKHEAAAAAAAQVQQSLNALSLQQQERQGSSIASSYHPLPDGMEHGAGPPSSSMVNHGSGTSTSRPTLQLTSPHMPSTTAMIAAALKTPRWQSDVAAASSKAPGALRASELVIARGGATAARQSEMYRSVDDKGLYPTLSSPRTMRQPNTPRSSVAALAGAAAGLGRPLGTNLAAAGQDPQEHSSMSSPRVGVAVAAMGLAGMNGMGGQAAPVNTFEHFLPALGGQRQQQQQLA